MDNKNIFKTQIKWTGNRGQGTKTYRGYDRSWDMQAQGKPVVACSNDPILSGDPTKYNPEDLLLSALSACHMLWYLHLASDAGIMVTAYEDTPIGEGETEKNGAGRFVNVTLHPVITVPTGTDLAVAGALHHDVERFCYIARSMNFPIQHKVKFRLS